MAFRKSRRSRKSKPKSRTYTRKSYKRAKRSLTFKVLRWSSADATNNCCLTITGNDAVPSTDGSALFQLNHVNGFNELVNLFDNYRMLKVMYRWVITRDPNSVTTTANKGLYPRIVWTHDFNDGAAITRSQIYQRANLKEAFMGDNYQKTRWYTIKPAVLAQMYESGVATAYSPQWRKWLDTADNATPHYAVKYNIDQNFTGMTVRMEAKILVECKGIS